MYIDQIMDVWINLMKGDKFSFVPSAEECIITWAVFVTPSFPLFCLHVPSNLSEVVMFVHSSVLKLIFMSPVWEPVTQDLATAFLEA